MKSKTQVLARRRASAHRLGRAEEAYTMAAAGTADEARWLRRCRQLENEIGILDWVLGEETPKPIKKRPKEPEPEPFDPERQRIIDEYGAFCNPKRYGE